MNSEENPPCAVNPSLSTAFFGAVDSLNLFRAPYPSRYEQRLFARGESLIVMRPIKPDDGPMLVELFKSLSGESIFLRFLTNLKSLPEEWLYRFTNIDYERDVAMVALEESRCEKRIIGVCRICRRGRSAEGEAAVVVGDQWQGQGIGRALLERSLEIGEELGMKVFRALVLCHNHRALALAEKLGFTILRDEDVDTVDLEMVVDLRSQERPR